MYRYTLTYSQDLGYRANKLHHTKRGGRLDANEKSCPYSRCTDSYAIFVDSVPRSESRNHCKS